MKNKKAFTLVELMVIVVILAILSTIGMVTYDSYLSGVRDVNRTAQLKSLKETLEVYSLRARLPIPSNNVEVQFSGSVVAVQGLLGPDIIEAIGYTEEGVDPKEKTPFNYYLTVDRKYFQLMAFLEDEIQVGYLPSNNTYAAINYRLKFPITEGSKLGILVGAISGPDKYKPLDTLGLNIDLKDTTIPYTAILLSEKYMLTGTGLVLGQLVDVLKVGGRGYTVSSTGELLFTDLDNL